MTEKIKIDGNSIQIGNKVCYCVDKDLIDYITNLQQKDFESQKEIMKLKDKLEQQRKEYQDTYKDVRIEIKEKNERIANLQQQLDKANDIIEKDRQFYKCRMDEYVDYKSRIKKASNKLDSMFANGEENKILDDLLELYKIVKGDKQC